eukprot:1154955-Pelagomonas_calceolata.AAC.8
MKNLRTYGAGAQLIDFHEKNPVLLVLINRFTPRLIWDASHYWQFTNSRSVESLPKEPKFENCPLRNAYAKEHAKIPDFKPQIAPSGEYQGRQSDRRHVLAMVFHSLSSKAWPARPNTQRESPTAPTVRLPALTSATTAVLPVVHANSPGDHFVGSLHDEVLIPNLWAL